MPPPRDDDALATLPRPWLRACLLLLVAEQPAHGYDLLVRLAELGMDRIDAAGLYRALRAMDQEGLLRSSWEPSTEGPARRTYAVTAEGMEWLHVCAGSLHLVEQSLERYRDRYAAVTRAPRGTA